MPLTKHISSSRKNDTRQKQACCIIHPSGSYVNSIKHRLMFQIIAHKKGRINCYGHRHFADGIAFAGSPEDETTIQEMVNKHVPAFWGLVEALYADYVDRHGLYINEYSHPTATLERRDHLFLDELKPQTLIAKIA